MSSLAESLLVTPSGERRMPTDLEAAFARQRSAKAVAVAEAKFTRDLLLGSLTLCLAHVLLVCESSSFATAVAWTLALD